jgi:hypothetical protein
MAKTFGLKDAYVSLLLAVLIAALFYISLRFDWKLGFVILFLLVVMSVKKITSVPQRVGIAMACQSLGLLLMALAATKEVALFLSFGGSFCLIILSLIVWIIGNQLILQYLEIVERRS